MSVEVHKRCGLVEGQRSHDRKQVVSAKGSLAGGHPIQDATQAEQIRTRIDRLSGQLLGGHVRRGADQQPELSGPRIVSPGFCATKVEDFDLAGVVLAVGGRTRLARDGRRPGIRISIISRVIPHLSFGHLQPDIGRFDVAVQKAASMGGRKTQGNLAPDADDFADAQAAVADEMLFERLAVEQFEGDERGLTVHAHLVNRHDMLVFQDGGTLRFAEEAIQSARLCGNGRVHQFERDAPLEATVFGLEHDGHAANTEHAQHTEIGNSADFIARLWRVQHAIDIRHRYWKPVFLRLRAVVGTDPGQNGAPKPADWQIDRLRWLATDAAAGPHGFEEFVGSDVLFQSDHALRTHF